MSVSITGRGALCGLGLDLNEIWSAIVAGQSAINEQGLAPLSATQYTDLRALTPRGFRNSRDQEPGTVALLAHAAAREAMREAGWDRLGPEDGLILATTTGHILHWEELLMQGYRSGDFAAFLAAGGIATPGRSLEDLRALLGFEGPNLLISSACSAATQALALASSWVEQGRVKRCLVGGSEVLTRLSTEGFRCLGLLSEKRGRPFDKARSGINLSEAAAFFCVERADAPRTQAWIRGHAMSADAHHLTAPHPEGRGTQQVFRDAIALAGLEPSQIDWIHAHGTGSLSNDKAEAFAIAAVFGDQVPVTSTKGYHGHALGAAGALESAICLEALRRQMRLGTLGFETPDDGAAIRVQARHEAAPIKNVFKNSLGFGGVNAALVLSSQAPVAQKMPTRKNESMSLVAGVIPSSEKARELGSLPEFRRSTVSISHGAIALYELLEQKPELRELATQGRVGLIVASSVGEIDATRDFLKELALNSIARPFLFQLSSHNSTLGFLSQHFGFRGPCLTVTNQYVTGENALEAARLLLDSGSCDYVIAIGCDFGIADWVDTDMLKRCPRLRPRSGSAALLLSRAHDSAPARLTALKFGSNSAENSPSGDFYDTDLIERVVRALNAREPSGSHRLTRPDLSLTEWSLERA